MFEHLKTPKKFEKKQHENRNKQKTFCFRKFIDFIVNIAIVFFCLVYMKNYGKAIRTIAAIICVYFFTL